MLAETIDIRFGLLPDFRLFTYWSVFIREPTHHCVSEEMLYLEAGGGKEKTDGEGKEEEDGFVSSHKATIFK